MSQSYPEKLYAYYENGLLKLNIIAPQGRCYFIYEMATFKSDLPIPPDRLERRRKRIARVGKTPEEIESMERSVERSLNHETYWGIGKSLINSPVVTGFPP